MTQWLALAAAVVPVLVWLVVLYRADRFEPEPPRLIAKLFGLGVVSAFVALALSVAVGPSLPEPDELSGTVAEVLPPLLVGVFGFALTEEIAKLGLAHLGTRGTKEFDEPLDGIIYGGTVALGFAATETFFYILGSLETGGEPTVLRNSWVLPPGIVEGFFVTAPVRALLSAVGHLVFTGIAGYFLARYRLGASPARVAVFGLLAAAAVHTAYNLPLFLATAVEGTPGSEAVEAALLLLVWPAVWLVSLEIFLGLVGRAIAASPHRARSLATESARAADARQEFHRRRMRMLVGLPVLLGLTLWLPPALGSLGFTGDVTFAIALALVLGTLGFVLVTWRCPSCGAHLRIRYPRTCPYCGVTIRTRGGRAKAR